MNEKDTTWLASTTPLLVLQSEPMRTEGKSEVARPGWQVIGHVEGDPKAEGASGSTNDGDGTNQSEKQPMETVIREAIGFCDIPPAGTLSRELAVVESMNGSVGVVGVIKEALVG